MITGVVNSQHEATIRLSVQGVEGAELETTILIYRVA